MFEMKNDLSLNPGTWRGIERSEGKERSAIVRCSNGHIGRLWDHEIASDGVVTPSLVCPEDECDFHEWVKLVGWKYWA